MKICRPLLWILCGCLIVTGCAGWDPGPKTTQDPASADSWDVREKRRGLYGVDSRARDIERNLGVH